MARIGMVGLAAMGSPMDRNLLKVGYNLKVYDKAEAATLRFMVGGVQRAVSSATPILESMGLSIVHVGAYGAGQAVKIYNNMILGIIDHSCRRSVPTVRQARA